MRPVNFVDKLARCVGCHDDIEAIIVTQQSDTSVRHWWANHYWPHRPVGHKEGLTTESVRYEDGNDVIWLVCSPAICILSWVEVDWIDEPLADSDGEYVGSGAGWRLFGYKARMPSSLIERVGGWAESGPNQWLCEGSDNFKVSLQLGLTVEYEVGMADDSLWCIRSRWCQLITGGRTALEISIAKESANHWVRQ
jgi:hypothetical protein